MNMAYSKKDASLEWKHWTTIQCILGRVFFIKDMEADLKQGTDMLIATSKPVRVGIRLRRNRYYQNSKWRWQFTIRFDRPSGEDTEWQKLWQGLYTHLFYGFLSPNEKKIIQYFIGDMDIFRHITPTYEGPYLNHPPDSRLVAFNCSDFPKEFYLKKYPELYECNPGIYNERGIFND